MHRIYTTGVIDMLMNARSGSIVVLKDFMDGKIEYEGKTGTIFEDANYYHKFKSNKVESFYVEDNKLIIHIV